MRIRLNVTLLCGNLILGFRIFVVCSSFVQYSLPQLGLFVLQTLPKLSPCVPLYWRQLSGPYGVRGYGVTQSTSKDRSRFGRPSNTPRSDPPLSQRGRIGAPLIERSMQDADDVPSRIQVDSNRQGFGLKPHEENERDPNSEGYQSTGSSTHGNGSDPKQELTPLDRSDSSGVSTK